MDIPVDSILNRWKSYLTNISSNLMELSEQTEFQLIKLRAGNVEGGYTGVTKTRAEQCVEKIGALWRYFALLSEVMDKAVSVYDKHIFSYKAEEEVTVLFENTLIVIETERVDINDRNLLGSQLREKKETPQKLLKHMQESFESLCKDVTEIFKAEEAVQAGLSSIKSEIEKLNSTVKRLGILNAPSFDTSSVARIENDPLQGLAEIDKLVCSIERYRNSIRALEDEYNEVVLRLDKIRRMLSELNDLASKSRIVAIEAQKIFSVESTFKPVISEEVLDSLENWLKVLESKLSEGNLKAVRVGAFKLEDECSHKLQAERKNYEINCRDYNEWLDLKGELKALLAKVEALKTKGLLVGNSLDEIIGDARRALYSIPVKLGDCRKAIDRLRSNL